MGQSGVEDSDVLLSPAIVIGEKHINALDRQWKEGNEQLKKMHLDGATAWILLQDVDGSRDKEVVEEGTVILQP